MRLFHPLSSLLKGFLLVVCLVLTCGQAYGLTFESSMDDLELAQKRLLASDYKGMRANLELVKRDSLSREWTLNDQFNYRSLWAKYFQFTEQYDRAFTHYTALVDWGRNHGTDYYVSALIQRAEFFRYTFRGPLALADRDSVFAFIQREQVDSSILLTFYNRSAAISQQFEKTPEVVEFWCLKSLEYAKSNGDSLSIAVALNELAFFYENQKDTSCFELYSKALYFFRALQLPRYELNVLVNLARSHHHFARHKEAYVYSKQGMDKFSGKESNYALEPLFEFHYHISKILGRYEEALAAYEKYFQINRSGQEHLHKKELHEMEAKYGAQLKDLQLQKKDAELIEKDEALGLLERNRLAMIFVIVALFVIAVITFLFLNRIGEKNRVLDGLYQQRKMLMRESNHRIKNNLQLIITLIQKELNKDRNSPALLNLRAKIEAIGSLHRQLYLDDNLEEVELENYLKDLVRNLEDLIKEHQAELRIEVSPCSINFDKAVYLGLILTELIMNSVKHGFPAPDGRKAEIACLINVWEERLYFHYSDNGKGFANPESNAALIRLLVSQMEGEMKQNSDDGAFTQINIPL